MRPGSTLLKEFNFEKMVEGNGWKNGEEEEKNKIKFS